MGLLADARDRLAGICKERGVDASTLVAVRPLAADEAIGTADDSFVIKRGKEVVIEALVGEARGQAFTDHPVSFAGTVGDVLSLDLSDVAHRAITVATLNAVLRDLALAEGTVHCRDEDPGRCGGEVAAELERRCGRVRYGLVGLQPSILAGLVERFGADSVRVLDRNDDNIGHTRSGVEVWDGDTCLDRLIEFADVLLVTGSTVVNGTIDGIVARAAAGRKVIFFGNTISGVAALTGLDRICPFAQ